MSSTMLQGRQLVWIIQDHFRMTNTQGDLYGIQELFEVKLINDNVEAYLNAFDHVLLRQAEPRCDKMLEDLFIRQIEHSTVLKEIVNYYKCQTASIPTEKSRTNDSEVWLTPTLPRPTNKE